MSFFDSPPPPPYSALTDGCLAVNSSESLNKSACNTGEEKELEEERRETKTATGESISISCRRSLDAIQLLLVLLLLLLLRKESGGEKGDITVGESDSEKRSLFWKVFR